MRSGRATLAALAWAGALLATPVSWSPAVGASEDGPAATLAPPDSARMAALRARLATEPVVRIVGSRGARDVFHPVVDSAGIRQGAPRGAATPRPALFVTERAAPEPQVVPWSDISEIRVGGGATGRGLLIGSAAAVAITFVGLMVSDGGSTGDFSIAPGYVWTAAPLPLLGMIVGSKLGWRRVYPDGDRLTP